MFAALNIHKPAGITSRDVVDRIQRFVRPEKAGHAGTLDPLATGVLVVCVGQATRLVEFAQRLPKLYRATFLLGHQSETEDVEGAVEIRADSPRPAWAAVEAALPEFIGTISQRPPRHSAVKIAGRRAYQLARQGIDFEPTAKAVRIDRLEILDYAYPSLVVEVACGGGTYIRSLGRDLAATLGTTAVMSALERSAVGGFQLVNASSLEELDRDWRQQLLPANQLVAALPSIELSADEIQEIRHGRPIAMPQRVAPAAFPNPAGGDELAAVDASGALIAVVVRRDDGKLWPVRNLTQPE